MKTVPWSPLPQSKPMYPQWYQNHPVRDDKTEYVWPQLRKNILTKKSIDMDMEIKHYHEATQFSKETKTGAQ